MSRRRGRPARVLAFLAPVFVILAFALGPRWLARAAVTGSASPAAAGNPPAVRAMPAKPAAAGEPGDWPEPGGGSRGWDYSALSEIDVRNVSQLQTAWTHTPDVQTEELASMPVAADGLLAYCSGRDQVWVLDGATGRLRWHARAGIAAEAESGVRMSTAAAGIAGASEAACRGVVFQGGVLYFAGAGGHVEAWSASGGEVRWDSQVLPRDGSQGVLSGPPLVVGERVLVGSSPTQPGQHGQLIGLDARNGHEVWRIDLIGGPPGSWDARASWGRGTTSVGGGSAAMPGLYDPDAKRVYWTVGSPAPLFDWAGSAFQTHGPRPGDNLYTEGLLALDPVTGELLGWHQEIPHQVWVRDSAQSEMLLLRRAGRMVLVHPNRSGLVFVYGPDLKTTHVWQALKNFNLAAGVDPASGALRGRQDYNAGVARGVCPYLDGGFPGLPGAYSPQTGLWYKVAAEWCMDLSAVPSADPAAAASGSGPAQPGAAVPAADPMLGGTAMPVAPPGGRALGHLDARDPLTGAKVWTVEFPEPPLAALLVTGGKLLFVADGRGSIQALDAASGRRLWRYVDQQGHAGGLISYAAAGHQYIAVVAGWDSSRHPAFAQLFGPPYTGGRTTRAALRAFRLP